MTSPNQLHRPVQGRKIGGVCMGISKWLGWDPTIVRLLYVGGTILSLGSGLLVYALLCVLMPSEDFGAATQSGSPPGGHNL